MADEQLRLTASLKDNASAGIRKIGKEMQGVRKTPGMEQAQKWVRSFNDDVKNFVSSGNKVAGIMSSMGIGGLAAAGSIAALASGFKALAEHTLNMRELGREVGITTDALRAMERAGQHFGFDPSAMEDALKRLAGLMPILRRGGNNELTEALAKAPGLIAKIRGEATDTAAVFKDIRDYVNQLQNPQDRIKFWEQIFGNGDLEKLNAEGTGGFDAQVEKARRQLEPMTAAAQAQAQALRDSINEFNTAIDNLELKAAPAIFAGLKQSADDFRAAFATIEEAYKWFAAHQDHPIQDAGKSVVDAIHAQAVENKKHPQGIILDLPGWTDRAISAFGGSGRPSETPSVAPPAVRQLYSAPAIEEDRATRVRDIGGPPRASTLPPPAFQVPGAYDREMRARGPRDTLFDGVVVGALEKPILHLAGTLKTATASAEADGIKSAAFHPAGFMGSAGSNDPQSLLAAGVKEGMLAAMREWAGGASSVDPSTARSGIMPASFGGGGGGGNRVLGGGGFGSSVTAVSKDMTPQARALLDDLASGEAPGYNVMNGGGRFSDYSHHPGGRAAGRYQFLPSTWRRVSGALGLKDFSPESQDKGAWWLAQQDYAKRTGRDLQADLQSGDPSRIGGIGRALHSTWVSTNGSFASKYAGFLGRQSAGGASSRSQIHGELKLGSETYRYGSGGAGGSASIPFGDYPINPDSGNPWGRAHNAMDVNGTGQIWDKALGRMRTGIEMHAASTAEMVTHGCLGFLKDQYPQLKARVREMIAKTGHAYLHINKDGASITSSPVAERLKDAARADLTAEKRKAGLTGPQVVKVDGGIDAHVTLHDNGRSSTRIASRGHVRDSSINIRRAPQRTFTV